MARRITRNAETNPHPPVAVSSSSTSKLEIDWKVSSDGVVTLGKAVEANDTNNPNINETGHTIIPTFNDFLKRP